MHSTANKCGKGSVKREVKQAAHDCIDKDSHACTNTHVASVNLRAQEHTHSSVQNTQICGRLLPPGVFWWRGFACTLLHQVFTLCLLSLSLSTSFCLCLCLWYGHIYCTSTPLAACVRFCQFQANSVIFRQQKAIQICLRSFSFSPPPPANVKLVWSNCLESLVHSCDSHAPVHNIRVWFAKSMFEWHVNNSWSECQNPAGTRERTTPTCGSARASSRAAVLVSAPALIAYTRMYAQTKIFQKYGCSALPPRCTETVDLIVCFEDELPLLLKKFFTN